MSGKSLTPEQTISATEFRDLNFKYSDLSYRMGTNGERGLYPQYKSLRTKIYKLKNKFKNEWNLKIYIGADSGNVIINHIN